ncbi:hypothetical protein K437DRAFT_44668 [Tilletiaria anomala UBC 951]|uniref:HAD-like protein n=1 Tax=Tilletiaria anomala (strain ATCC 24038 / CBS 436.72 / UBC 951) TaxID=1037660 RepID=A0A066WDH9_TILAU|nr:uncharacterized protein K437DRAFT_44668 [Tilletiaria anomala UBC 951]KDN51982.1 hypothetical protein K437DRAFT_44668 [Tilletiaria anomala UBC 951]
MLLFSDWDETISNSDTLSLIAPPWDMDTFPERTSFSALAEAYVRDLEEHNLQHEKGTTLGDQLNFLDSLDAVELKSQDRVEKSQLFKGWNPVAADERARKLVEFRQGWSEAAAFIESRDAIQLHIISVGWSGRFIQTALATPRGGSCTPHSICANEIELDCHGHLVGTGKLTKSKDASSTPGRSGIRVASDKQREMRRIRTQMDRAGKQICVYAGDSNTDLACLLEVDVGLIFGEAESLLATLERIGLGNCVNTPEEWLKRGGKLGKRDLHAREKVLVHVRNWQNALPILVQLYKKDAKD